MNNCSGVLTQGEKEDQIVPKIESGNKVPTAKQRREND